MIPPRKGIRGDNSELVSDFWIIRVVDTNLSTRICPRIGTNILPHLKYVHKILAVTRLETDSMMTKSSLSSHVLRVSKPSVAVKFNFL